MPEPPQLTPLDMEEQRLYSESLPDVQAPHPISKGQSRPKIRNATKPFQNVAEGRRSSVNDRVASRLRPAQVVAKYLTCSIAGTELQTVSNFVTNQR